MVSDLYKTNVGIGTLRKSTEFKCRGGGGGGGGLYNKT